MCCVALPTKAFAIIQVPTDINAVLMPDGTIVNSEFTLDGSNSEEPYLVEANLNLNNGYEGNISFEKPFEFDTNKIEVNSKESVNGNLNITKFDKNADYGNRLTIGSIGWKIEPEYNLQFAVFSETDNSLSFYRKDKIPNVGETFNDKVVTEVYQDVNKVRAEESADLLTGGSSYGTPWNSRQSQIEKVFVKDSITPISTAYWFFMYSLDEIDISKLDTRLTDNMFAMFAGINAQAMKDNIFLDVSSLNTSNVKDMGFMFAQCFTKKIIGLQNFDTSKVTNMNAMFNYGIQRHLDLSSFTITESINTDNMLHDQLNLETLKTGSKVKFSGKEGLDGDWKDSQGNIFQITNFPANKEETYTRASNFPGELGGTAKIKSALVGKDVVYELKINNSSKYPDIYFSYEWYVDGQLVSEEKSYAPKPEEAGKKIKLKVNVLGSKTVVSNEVLIADKNTVMTFVVYSQDDSSLTFYKRKGLPDVGEQFNGKTATDVYACDFENEDYYDEDYLNKYDSPVPWLDAILKKPKTVVIADTIRPKSCAFWFGYMVDLESIVNYQNLDTSRCTNMAQMFYYDNKLNSLNEIVSGFETQNVTNMQEMFYFTNETNFDLRHFDTSNVTTMKNMFGFCVNLESVNIEGFNTSKVVNMEGMFSTCRKLVNITLGNGFDTSNVTTMKWMFSECKLLSENGIDLTKFNTRNVTNIYAMFGSCESFESFDFSTFDFSNVVEGEFFNFGAKNLRKFTLNETFDPKQLYLIAPFDTVYKDDYTDPFNWYTKDGYPLSEHKERVGLTTYYASTAKPSDEFAIFFEESGELNFYNRENAPDVGDIFDGKTVTKLYKGYDGIYVNKVPNAQIKPWPWEEVRVRIKTVNFVDKSRPVGVRSYFEGMENLENVENINNLDTRNATTINSLFEGCSSLKNIDLSSLNLSKISDITSLFEGCKSLKEVNLNFLGSPLVMYADFVFVGCEQLEKIDMSDFDTSKLTKDNTHSFFGGIDRPAGFGDDLKNLREIKVGDKVGFDRLSLLPTPNAKYIPDSDGRWYAKSDKIGYTPLNIPNNKADTYVANKLSDLLPEKVAFAVYSEDDQSLNFYKRNRIPKIGEQFEGKAVTKVYTDFENVWGYDQYNETPWSSIKSSVTNIEFVDEVNPRSTAYWFNNFSNLISAEITNLNTSGVENMSRMFSGCSKLIKIDGLSNLKTSNVKLMAGVFSYCNSLTTLDLSTFDTSKVSSMESMFENCISLKSINLSSFDTSNVRYMDLMFINCASMTALDLSNFDLSRVTSADFMFKGCGKLQQINFGAKFKWSSDRSYLPAPKSTEIPGADGKWYAESDGIGYTSSNIPSNKADTYYASKDLLPNKSLTGSLLLQNNRDTLTANFSDFPSDAQPNYTWLVKTDARKTLLDENVELSSVNKEVCFDVNILSDRKDNKIILKGNNTNNPSTRVEVNLCMGDECFSALLVGDRSVSIENLVAGKYKLTIKYNLGVIDETFSIGSITLEEGASSSFIPIEESSDVLSLVDYTGTTIKCEVADSSGKYTGSVVSDEFYYKPQIDANIVANGKLEEGKDFKVSLDKDLRGAILNYTWRRNNIIIDGVSGDTLPADYIYKDSYTGDGPSDISKRVDYLVEVKDLSGRYSGSSKSNFLFN